jgi:hypothetical protein
MLSTNLIVAATFMFEGHGMQLLQYIQFPFKSHLDLLIVLLKSFSSPDAPR